MSKRQKLPGPTDRQHQAINLLLDKGLLPDLIDGLDYLPPTAESVVMTEYREMYPGLSDADLERLADET